GLGDRWRRDGGDVSFGIAEAQKGNISGDKAVLDSVTFAMKTTPIRLGLTILGLFAVMLAARGADIPAAPLIEGDSGAASTLTNPTWAHALIHLKQKWDLNDQELVQIKATVVDQMEQLAFLRNDGMLTEDARRAKERET